MHNHTACVQDGADVCCKWKMGWKVKTAAIPNGNMWEVCAHLSGMPESLVIYQLGCSRGAHHRGTSCCWRTSSPNFLKCRVALIKASHPTLAQMISSRNTCVSNSWINLLCVFVNSNKNLYVTKRHSIFSVFTQSMLYCYNSRSEYNSGQLTLLTSKQLRTSSQSSEMQ